MTLIEEIMISGDNFKFYDGLDIDFILKHPKDGSNGFILCFVNNFENILKAYNRNSKISTLIEGTEFLKLKQKHIRSQFVIIYQSYKTIELYNIIRNKVIIDRMSSNSIIENIL